MVPDEEYPLIRSMGELSGGRKYLSPRSGRRERFKSSEFTKQKKSRDQIKKDRKKQRKNRRRK